MLVIFTLFPIYIVRPDRTGGDWTMQLLRLCSAGDTNVDRIVV
jgi:hypothetical protein